MTPRSSLASPAGGAPGALVAVVLVSVVGVAGCPPSSGPDGGVLVADAGDAPTDGGSDGGAPSSGDGGTADGGGGPSPDAGLDAGGDLDGGGPRDGGAAADAGGPSDAGAPSDAGVPVDAGGLSDAGPPVVIDPVAGAGAVELVQEGFTFLEGPAWDEDAGVLLFTDIPENRIWQLVLPDQLSVFREPSDHANGLAFDTSGALLAAEHGARRVSRTLPDGGVVALVDNWQGSAFNSPNDLVVRSDGTVYFTDPPYGLDGRPQEIPFHGVFRVPPGGAAVAEWQGDANARPNGVVLSPDELVLYVADSAEGVVRAWDVAPGGALSGERIFAGVPGPDGMAVDVAGNLYVTSSSGVVVLRPDGQAWGTLVVPRQPANCAFGGPGKTTLFMTAREGLYRVELPLAGL